MVKILEKCPLKARLKVICSIHYEPTILVVDLASAITNGFSNVFVYMKKLVSCWFHVSEIILKELSVIKDAKIKSEIYQDICSF